MVTAAVPVVISDRPGGHRPEPAPMPTMGPLVDSHGRIHDDLRISVTDRCNLRCIYCMPEHGMTFLPHSDLLSFDEIVRVAQVARTLGVSSVRLTGGEPLVRRRLPELVGRHRVRGPGHDDERGDAGRHGRRPGGGRAPAGEREL
jgi:cyclic pyranopterin phosphate synthase